MYTIHSPLMAGKTYQVWSFFLKWLESSNMGAVGCRVLSTGTVCVYRKIGKDKYILHNTPNA